MFKASTGVNAADMRRMRQPGRIARPEPVQGRNRMENVLFALQAYGRSSASNRDLQESRAPFKLEHQPR